MRKILLVLGFLLSVSFGFGQMLTPTIVASSGGFYFSSAAGASLSVTAGEMAMVETFFANNHFLTQGFQQPDEKEDGIWIDAEDYFEVFEIYPNPASDRLNIRYQLKYPGSIHLRFFDMSGIEVFMPFHSPYSGGLQIDELDVNGLSQGMYFLHVTYESPSQGISDATFHKINIIR